MHLILSFQQSNTDIRLLWASVFVRMAGYGLTNQVLTLFLEASGVPELRIGLFMTLTLLGDTAISYVLTWYAEEIGRRTVMVIGSVMMLASGLVFATSSSYVVLLTAAIVGVISPSGDETGPFKSVEEASIAHLTPHNHRPEVFAFYGVFGTAGAALGSVVAGVLVDHLHSMGYSLLTAYRFIFFVYGGIAIVKVGLMLCLSKKCEANQTHQHDENSETSTLLAQPQGLSQNARYYLPRLLAIFMLDSLGYGFMPSAWVVFYFKKVFQVTATTLGVLFLCTNAVDSISSLPSAYFAKWLGPVKAILFTQAPAAVFFLLMAFTSRLPIAATLYFLNCAGSTMDVVPRQVLLTSIMSNHEITKVMGIINIGKTLARCVGPIFTGHLAEAGALRYGFVINSLCVLLADLILACNFLSLDLGILQKQSHYQEIE